MIKPLNLVLALLTISNGFAMEQEKKEFNHWVPTLPQEYQQFPKTYPGMSKDYPPQPLRVSAEFADRKFPENITEIVIVDLAGNREREVGKLTPKSPRAGVRWSVNENYEHNYEYVQLAFKVMMAGYSALENIPAQGGAIHEIITPTGEKKIIHCDPFKMPTMFTTNHYIPSIRLYFQGNLASPTGLRASSVVGKPLPMNATPRPFSGRSANTDGPIPEGCPENDPQIFKTLPVRATLITDDYGWYQGLTQHQREYTIDEIARDMADYYLKAKAKYGVGIDLDKLGRSFSQRGHYRSNLTPEIVQRMKQVLTNNGDEGVNNLLNILNYRLNISK